MTKLSILLASFSLALAACGGSADDAGIDQNKKLVSLTADEKMSFCTWSIATRGGEGKKTQCDAEKATTVETAPECIQDLNAMPSSCAVTVGQAEACIKAVAADPCHAIASPACAPLLACS